MTERLHFHFSLSCIGEGNGNPLQGSCLENPRDGGAWWAAIYGIAESDTTEATAAAGNTVHSTVALVEKLSIYRFVLIYLLLGEGRCSKLRITERTSLLGSEPNQDKRQSEGIKFKVYRRCGQMLFPPQFFILLLY